MVRAFVTSDSYWIVTRGYLADYVEPIRRARDAQVAQNSKDIQDKFDKLDEQYRDLSENQLANRVGMLELTIVVLNQELTTVELRLKVNDRDIVALGRRLAILNSLKGAEEQRRLLLCRLDKGREQNAACQ
jgi:septal ring factor EnvC (AmiA/AmiB activator)